jgi:pimeloyl-ACP methyl ester carboxylesterase
MIQVESPDLLNSSFMKAKANKKKGPIMSRPNLILLHGSLGSSSQFHPMIPLLKDKYDVHTLDFEGHGSSPPKDRPFRSKYFAENVLDYMNGNAVNAADIFGHSMGGHIGLYLARFSPERVKRVFTLGTKFLWTPEIGERENAFLDPNKILDKVPKYARELQRRHIASGYEKILEKTREMNVNLGEQTVLKGKDIQAIKRRVRIGVGDRDYMVTIDESVGVYRLLQKGELQIFPGTPHPIEKVSLSTLTYSILDFFT